MGAATLLPPKTSGHRRKPDRSHHRVGSGATSAIRTCHQRSQDNAGRLAGCQRHSPDSKGAVVSSLPEAGRRLWAQASPCSFASSMGLRLGGTGMGRVPAWLSLIHSSHPHSVPWQKGSCPGCHRGALACLRGRGCCWWLAGGWPTAGRPPSARGPSCGGQPRWPCGYSGSRRAGGRRAPWGRGHSKSTAGPLEGGSTRAAITVCIVSQDLRWEQRADSYCGSVTSRARSQMPRPRKLHNWRSSG